MRKRFGGIEQKWLLIKGAMLPDSIVCSVERNNLSGEGQSTCTSLISLHYGAKIIHRLSNCTRERNNVLNIIVQARKNVKLQVSTAGSVGDGTDAPRWSIILRDWLNIFPLWSHGEGNPFLFLWHGSRSRFTFTLREGKQQSKKKKINVVGGEPTKGQHTPHTEQQFRSELLI